MQSRNWRNIQQIAAQVEGMLSEGAEEPVLFLVMDVGGAPRISVSPNSQVGPSTSKE